MTPIEIRYVGSNCFTSEPAPPARNVTGTVILATLLGAASVELGCSFFALPAGHLVKGFMEAFGCYATGSLTLQSLQIPARNRARADLASATHIMKHSYDAVYPLPVVQRTRGPVNG